MNVINRKPLMRVAMNVIGKPLFEEDLYVYIKKLVPNCNNCRHLMEYKHTLQELHYKNGPIGECKKLNRLIYSKNNIPVCGGMLYEYDDGTYFR